MMYPAQPTSQSNPISVVLIPAYNPGHFLKQAVDSFLNQEYSPSKIVVIDDGSTDDSISSIEHYEETGLIEIHRNKRNIGRAQSVNAALIRYKADYFILQDADDLAKPDRVSRQIHFMEENPDLACSSSFIEYIDAGGRIIGKGKLDLLDDERLNQYLASNEPFGLFCPAIILRANVVKDPALQFRGEFWPADDIDLWNRIAEAGHKVRAQPEYLVQYRIHGNSVVTSGFKKTRMQFEWLRDCLRARRAGLPEPSNEEFLKKWNNAPIFTRINRSRKIYAKGYYRAAGFAYAERDWLLFMRNGLAAAILQPSYTVSRSIKQLAKY